MFKKLTYSSLAVLTFLTILLFSSGILLGQPTNPLTLPDFMRGTTQTTSTAISPAPPAKEQGRWISKAPLPIPRTEMTWAAVWDNKMHVIGGYNYKGGFDGNYHHVYDAKTNTWSEKSPIPRGVNHVGTVASNGNIYAVGGFIEQNKNPVDNVWKYNIASDKWIAVAPLPKARGAVSVVELNGKIHVIGGRDSDNISVGTHEVYEPTTNTWKQLAPLPGGRDHIGVVVANGFIHAIGGRFNTYEYNSGLHYVYSPNTNQWKERAPMPTARSGHGAVWYRGRIFVMGGEGSSGVFAQVEAYDPVTNK
jgi:N-acetylneuraminic acid mutarotase